MARSKPPVKTWFFTVFTLQSKVNIKELAWYVDTIQVCLSKGLPASAGGIIVDPVDPVKITENTLRAKG